MGERWGVWISQPLGAYFMRTIIDERGVWHVWEGTSEEAKAKAAAMARACPEWSYEAKPLDPGART